MRLLCTQEGLETIVGVRGHAVTGISYKNLETLLVYARNSSLREFLLFNGRVNRALQKVKSGRSPGEDLREKHKVKKIADELKQGVIDHINSFPAYQSHYCRKDNPNRKFLSPELNLRKMYHLYVEKCSSLNTSAVKEHYYRHIFNTEFNLAFHVPRKDTCMKCDRYLQLINLESDEQVKADLNSSHDQHLQQAEKARAALKNAAVVAKKTLIFMHSHLIYRRHCHFQS
jgi:hypothetical protein